MSLFTVAPSRVPASKASRKGSNEWQNSGGSSTMTSEARKHVRYALKEGILAALSLPGTLQLIIGQIIDVSESGLALRHGDQIATTAPTAELFLIGRERLEDSEFNVTARLVYDQDLGTGHRSGFEFRDLTENQASRLASFIRFNMESTPPVSYS